MTYGRICRSLPAFLLLLASCLFTCATLSAPARPLPVSDLPVTLLSAGPGVLQVQGADGRQFAIRVTPKTWVLQRGLVILPRDLVPGEPLRVREVGGTARLVCDEETADALAAHRRRPLSGTILSVESRVWTVQPLGGDVPLPILLTARTLFRAGGSLVAASAFGPGAAVTILTRRLANGLLAAVSVSDAAPETVPDPPGQTAGGQTPRPVSVSGVIIEARPDLGLLTLQDASGAARTVAVDAGTRLKSGGRAAAWGDLAAGMRVRVRLGAGQDAAGNPVATSVSTSAGRPAGKAAKGKRR